MGIEPQIGDVLAVSSRKPSWTSKMIEIGQILQGKPGLNNHIVIVHHKTNNVWWGLEGKPGGVGWADVRRYLRDPHTVSNTLQPKTFAQRNKVAKLAETMIGTPYDWAAIATDSLRSMRITNLFDENWDNKGVPGHVVCSSLAAWVYDRTGLERPTGEGRYILPADWTEFNLTKKWGRL